MTQHKPDADVSYLERDKTNVKKHTQKKHNVNMSLINNKASPKKEEIK